MINVISETGHILYCQLIIQHIVALLIHPVILHEVKKHSSPIMQFKTIVVLHLIKRRIVKASYLQFMSFVFPLREFS